MCCTSKMLTPARYAVQATKNFFTTNDRDTQLKKLYYTKKFRFTFC